MSVITSLLSSTGYIVINRALMKRIGVNESILLGELCSEYEYWHSRGKLSEDGFFFSTIENIENATTLSGKVQRAAIKSLVKLGILETKRKGTPPVRLFRIHQDVLGAMLAQDSAPDASAPCEADTALSEADTAADASVVVPDIPQVCPNGTIKCAESEQSNMPNRNIRIFPNGTNVCSQTAQTYVPKRHTNNTYINKNKNKNKETRDMREGKRDVASACASANPARHIYGQYENVLLSDDDVEKLKTEFPDYRQRIERLSEYIASKGTKYKNHLATIRAWAKKDGKPNAEHGANHTEHDAEYAYGVGWNKIL